jgi:hypothetical protein
MVGRSPKSDLRDLPAAPPSCLNRIIRPKKLHADGGRSDHESQVSPFVLLFCLIAPRAGLGCPFEIVSPVVASSPATLSASLTPKIEGSKIYFVPIGDFPIEQLQPLVEFCRQKYKLGIAVLHSIPVVPVTRDASRQQLVAENLVASVRSRVPEHSSDQGAILSGFTSEDIYRHR